LLKNINPGSSGFSTPYENHVILDGNKYFFYADDGLHGNELWMTDGTNTGTKMVKDIAAFGSSINPQHTMGAYKGAVYFSADMGSSDYFLWKSDGTSAGTKQFKQIKDASSFTNYNGKLYFIASDYFFKNRELWVTDSSSDGTKMTGSMDMNCGLQTVLLMAL
jgi:ELWxxDGT repeat protein